MDKENKNFKDLVGKELSAVVFIRDYVQLQFDPSFATMTINIYPLIQIHENSFSFGDIEYRNKLCELIGDKVILVDMVNDNMILKFSLGIKLVVSKEMNELDLSELVILECKGYPTVVWQ